MKLKKFKRNREESLTTGTLDQSSAPVIDNGGAAEGITGGIAGGTGTAGGTVVSATDNHTLRAAGYSWDLIENDQHDQRRNRSSVPYNRNNQHGRLCSVSTGSDSYGRKRNQLKPVRAEPGRRTEQRSDSVLQPGNKGMGADGAKQH